MRIPTLTLLLLVILICGGEGHAQVEGQQHRYVCPPSFIHLGHSCYYFSSEMATWHSAHFSCRDRGSQLAALETSWEDSNVRSYLSRPEFNKCGAAKGEKERVGVIYSEAVASNIDQMKTLP